jgi:hypothetical protein
MMAPHGPARLDIIIVFHSTYYGTRGGGSQLVRLPRSRNDLWLSIFFDCKAFGEGGRGLGGLKPVELIVSCFLMLSSETA